MTSPQHTRRIGPFVTLPSSEAEYGRQWRALAWDEGHRANLPPTVYKKNDPLEFDEVKLRQRIKAGHSMRSIARDFGASPNSIQSFIRRRRIPVKKLRKEGAA